MRIEYKEKFYNAEYPDGYTYVGIYIYLYGCNDVVVDYLYLNYLDKWNHRSINYRKNLYEELLVHKKELSKLTSNEKLKVLAGSSTGRRDLQRFAIPHNNFHFAGIDFDNNERLVPDWYINNDGPVSRYRSGNIMYSEYSNKPLDHEERLKRYHGILQQKKTITQMTAETLQRGVRRLFNLSGGAVSQRLPEVVAVLADPPAAVAPPDVPPAAVAPPAVADALLPPTSESADALLLLTPEPLKAATGESLKVKIPTERPPKRHKVEPPKIEEPKAEASKIEEPKATPKESGKVELPRAPSPKVDAGKVELPRAPSPKVDADKVELPRAPSPKVEASKVELPKAKIHSTASSTASSRAASSKPAAVEKLDALISANKSVEAVSDIEPDVEVRSKEALPPYTKEDEARGNRQAAIEIVSQSIIDQLEKEILALPSNEQGIVKHLDDNYSEHSLPTYNESQRATLRTITRQTFITLANLRGSKTQTLRDMAPTYNVEQMQEGQPLYFGIAQNFLRTHATKLINSGIPIVNVAKLNDEIVNELVIKPKKPFNSLRSAKIGDKKVPTDWKLLKFKNLFNSQTTVAPAVK